MTDKAYIVANKQQEREVLEKLEENGFTWTDSEQPTSWVPSDKMFVMQYVGFPYVLSSSDEGDIIWFSIESLENETIVYDGRNEEKKNKKNKKYKVTQKFMDELANWRKKEDIDATIGHQYNYVWSKDLEAMPRVTIKWLINNKNPIERNKRLIAVIQWLNGEDVFDVEAPHKFIVRSDKSDNDGDYIYVQVKNGTAVRYRYYASGATRFDTREEAQEWANDHQVVVEIDEDGNEVD